MKNMSSPLPGSYVNNMPDLPSEIHRNVASFAREANSEVQSGDRFLGRGRHLARDAGRCMCGLCVTTDAPTAATCTLCDDDARVVTRRTTELCRAVCMSRFPLMMLLKFVRTLLQRVSSMIPTEARTFVRVTLQKEVRPELADTSPYLIDAFLDLVDHHLELDFLKLLDDSTPDFALDYAVGQELPETLFPKGLNSRLERALIELSRHSFSLVVVAPGLREAAFSIGSIRFEHEEGVFFRARPLYIFIQASPAAV